jgi:hypothetical protein
LYYYTNIVFEIFQIFNNTGTNPWGAQLPRVDFNIVVVDSCPYNNNREWCPLNVGDPNSYGFEYHFDLFFLLNMPDGQLNT